MSCADFAQSAVRKSDLTRWERLYRLPVTSCRANLLLYIADLIVVNCIEGVRCEAVEWLKVLRHLSAAVKDCIIAAGMSHTCDIPPGSKTLGRQQHTCRTLLHAHVSFCSTPTHPCRMHPCCHCTLHSLSLSASIITHHNHCAILQHHTGRSASGARTPPATGSGPPGSASTAPVDAPQTRPHPAAGCLAPVPCHDLPGCRQCRCGWPDGCMIHCGEHLALWRLIQASDAARLNDACRQHMGLAKNTGLNAAIVFYPLPFASWKSI